MHKSRLASFLLLILVVCAADRCREATRQGEPQTTNCNPDGTLPAWLSELIKSGPASNKSIIIQYKYTGQAVFSVNMCLDCADAMTVVYDCDQNVVCQFGGIAGLNTCPDFEQNATRIRVIWEN